MEHNKIELNHITEPNHRSLPEQHKEWYEWHAVRAHDSRWKTTERERETARQQWSWQQQKTITYDIAAITDTFMIYKRLENGEKEDSFSRSRQMIESTTTITKELQSENIKKMKWEKCMSMLQCAHRHTDCMLDGIQANNSQFQCVILFARIYFH